MGKSKKRPSVEESENEVFHVEILMAARVVAADSDSDADVGEKKKKKKDKGKGKDKDKAVAQWEYLVKWAGYDSDANSWEPEANVAECQRLLKSFWAEFEDHERDYAVGDVIEPSKKWIKKEKKFFAREFSDAQEKLRLDAERAERERTKKATKKRLRKSEPGEPMGSSSFPKKQRIVLSDAEDEETHIPLRIVVPAKRKEPPVSTESSDDDVPLSSQVRPKKIMKTGESSRAATNLTKEPPKKPTPPIPRRPQVPLPLPPIPQKAGTATVVNMSKNSTDKPALPSQRRSTTTTPVIPQKVPSSLVDKGKQKTVEQPSHQPGEPSLFSAPSSPVEVPSNVPPRRPLPLPKPPMKTTPTIPPKIPRRMTNPHTKLSGMAPEAMSSGSGLSTKQRLAQGALAPTLPKAVAPATARGSRPTLPPVKTTSLMPNLSFKKTPKTPVLSANASGSGSMSNLAADQAQGMRVSQVSADRNKLTLAALNMPPSSHGSVSGSPAPGFLDMPLVASPQGYTPQEQEPGFSNPFTGNAASPPTSMGPPPLARTAAEEFLAKIMPPALAAPLLPAVDQPIEPRPPPSHVPPKALLLPSSKIPKKWKWTGKLYFEGQNNPICNVTMCDATGAHFSSFMNHWDHITLPSFHDVADVSTILRACKPPTHIARLAPATIDDNGPMTVLSVHIVKHQKVIFVPVKLDNSVVGHILLFHHVMGQFIHRFNIPPEVQELRSLVGVFLPWILSKDSRELQWRKPPGDYLPAKIKFESMVPDKSRWAQLVRTKPFYQHALRILKFPQKLHEFMSQEKHHRTYGLCPETGMRKGRRGLETAMLVSIMEQCRAKLKSPVDARVVFIHISALKNVLKLPLLLNQRKENLIQFYVYGSHYSISPEYWGFSEIYQCGGIVTFTPLAILEDPIGIKKKIKEVHQHPFWACYILPTVLGMTVKLDAEGADPADLFQKGELLCGFLPKAITKGKLSLMRAPPDWTGNSKQKNLAWAAEHYSHSPQTIQEILEATLNSFKAKYANIPEPQQHSKINSEICFDLVSMQHQLAIMTRYRRYIVIRAPNEVQPSYAPGLEWTTAQDFDFRDDFII